MSDEKSSIRILLVEDNPGEALLIKESLEEDDLDCRVDVVHSGKDCFESDLTRYDLILLDYNLPDMLGVEVLKRVQELRKIPVLMVTGMDATEIAVEALKIGAYDYIVKSDQYLEHLPIAIEKVVEKHRLELESKRLQEELRESEEKHRTLVATAVDGVLSIDPEMKIILWNPGSEKIFGYTEKEMLGQNVMKIVPQRYRKAKKRGFAQFRKTGLGPVMGETIEIEGLRKDGSEVPIELSVSSRKSGEGYVTTAIVRDVTERKRAEEALERLAEEKKIVANIGRIIGSTLEIDKVYELFAEAVSRVIPFDRIAINIVYPETYTFTVVYIAGENVGGRRSGDVAPLAGSLTEEVMRTRSGGLIQSDDADEVARRFPGLLPFLQAGYQSLMAVPLISKGQVIGTMHLQSAKPEAYTAAEVNLAEDIGSQIAGAIANAQLYAERKRAEEEIKNKNRELEDFAYTVSHDLKNPLWAINGYSSAVLEDYGENLDEEGKDYLLRIKENTQKMGNFINDLLKYSRAGVQPDSFKEVDLSRVLKEVLRDMKEQIDEKSIQLITHDLPSVLCDETRIGQVFANLIHNAIKFSRDKGALIEVGCDDDEMEYRFYVKDNGVGFDKKDRDKIFRIFRHLDQSKDYQGTGIGLAIVKKVVESHGGKIWADGKKGKGATFSFTLPKKTND
ncbi:MAG: PAS domain S-box protein [Thermodesulfobacteriota bacterium]